MLTPRLRVLLLNLGLVLVLLGLAGFAYFSGHPRSIYLQAAEDLPGIGLVAAKLRTAYLGPDPDADPSGIGVIPRPGPGDDGGEYVLIGPDGRELSMDGPLDLSGFPSPD